MAEPASNPTSFHSDQMELAEDDEEPSTNLVADLVPLLHHLCALAGEEGLEGQEERVAVLLLDLQAVYPGKADSLNIMKHLREQMPSDASVIAGLHRQLAKGIHQLDDQQLSSLVMPTGTGTGGQQKAANVSIFDSFNFDDLPAYESVGELIQPLSADIADPAGWLKLLGADPMELLEHPQWADVLDILQLGLRSGLSVDSALVVHALLGRYLTAFAAHYQGMDVLKMYFAHLIHVWQAHAQHVQPIVTALQRSELHVLLRGLRFLCSYAPSTFTKAVDEQCMTALCLLLPVLPVILQADEMVSVLLDFLVALPALQVIVLSRQSGFLSAVLNQLDASHRRDGLMHRIQLLRILLTCLQPMGQHAVPLSAAALPSPKITATCPLPHTNKRHHSMSPADDLIDALLHPADALPSSDLLDKHVASLLPLVAHHLLQVDARDMDSDPTTAALSKLLDMTMRIQCPALIALAVRVFQLPLVRNCAESNIARKLVALFADHCIICSIPSLLLTVLPICLELENYASMKTETAVDVLALAAVLSTPSQISAIASKFFVLLSNDDALTVRGARLLYLLDKLTIHCCEANCAVPGSLMLLVIALLQDELASNNAILPVLQRIFLRLYSMLRCNDITAANVFLSRLATWICSHPHAAENVLVFHVDDAVQGCAGNDGHLIGSILQLLCRLMALGFVAPLLATFAAVSGQQYLPAADCEQGQSRALLSADLCAFANHPAHFFLMRLLFIYRHTATRIAASAPSLFAMNERLMDMLAPTPDIAGAVTEHAHEGTSAHNCMQRRWRLVHNARQLLHLFNAAQANQCAVYDFDDMLHLLVHGVAQPTGKDDVRGARWSSMLMAAVVMQIYNLHGLATPTNPTNSVDDSRMEDLLEQLQWHVNQNSFNFASTGQRVGELARSECVELCLHRLRTFASQSLEGALRFLASTPQCMHHIEGSFLGVT